MPFKVVGVLAPKGFASLGMDKDDVVFVPYSTGDRKLFGLKFLGTIGAGFLSVEAPEQMNQVTEEANRILRQRHRLRPDQADDFTVKNQLDSVRIQEGAAESMTRLLLCVASISLLVGGVGIMNILLVSVSERTREIGIRMAVGAKRWHIVLQFLVEAMVLSAAGGVAGIAVGVIGARIASQFAGWPTVISPHGLILAVGLSALVGLFSGLYPADRASRLNPIETLRYE
jgi:putative ABC transport system permease protein